MARHLSQEFTYSEYEYKYLDRDYWVENQIELLQDMSKQDIDDFVTEASKYASKEDVNKVLDSLSETL
jgi:hypothetical protein